MRQLDCSSLIRLHEVYETENSLYMVLDLLEGGSLYDKIKVRNFIILNSAPTDLQPQGNRDPDASLDGRVGAYARSSYHASRLETRKYPVSEGQVRVYHHMAVRWRRFA